MSCPLSVWKPKLDICDSRRCLPAGFHRFSLCPFLVDPFSLLWLSQLRNYRRGNSPVLLSRLAHCFTGPLAKTSGWLIICTSSTSFSKLREADVLFHTRKASRNLVSLGIWRCLLLISLFSNGFVLRLFMSRASWSPWKLAGAFGLNTHQVKQLFGADTSSYWSKIACASLSIWFVKFITHKVRETHMEKLKRHRNLKIRCLKVCHFCCLLWTARLCHIVCLFLFVKLKYFESVLIFQE